MDKQHHQLNQFLLLAIQIATKAHAGQVDRGGHPYIQHPQAVAASVTSTEHKIVAYLHDVVEDTEVRLEDLQKMGFPPRIVKAIGILTKPKQMRYLDYIAKVKEDELARVVKVADLHNNMDLSRIPEPAEKDYARVEKYKKALAILES